MTKKSRQNINYLENEKTFKDEIKSIFKGLSLKEKQFLFGRSEYKFKKLGSAAKIQNVKEKVKFLIRENDMIPLNSLMTVVPII